MSRKIKFRMWRVPEKTMHPNSDLTLHQGESYEQLCFHVKRENEILMQYTGLEDKNGKEIYDGDIVKTTEWIRGEDDEEHISQIRWASEGFRCCWWVEGRSISLSVGVVDELKLEVIGNIYENPELIESSHAE